METLNEGAYTSDDSLYTLLTALNSSCEGIYTSYDGLYTLFVGIRTLLESMHTFAVRWDFFCGYGRLIFFNSGCPMFMVTNSV